MLNAEHQHDIFHDGQCGHQHEMLVHHTESVMNRVFGGTNGNFLAVNNNSSGIWFKQSIENVHQGTFTRSVLTEKGMDFSDFHAKIQLVVCYKVTEFFSDSSQFKSRSCLSFLHFNLSQSS